jgi:hypothetical protein
MAQVSGEIEVLGVVRIGVFDNRDRAKLLIDELTGDVLARFECDRGG